MRVPDDPGGHGAAARERSGLEALEREAGRDERGARVDVDGERRLRSLRGLAWRWTRLPSLHWLRWLRLPRW